MLLDIVCTLVVKADNACSQSARISVFVRESRFESKERLSRLVISSGLSDFDAQRTVLNLTGLLASL